MSNETQQLATSSNVAEDEKTYISNVTLGHDLRKTNLTWVDFEGADLSHADLRKAYLQHAWLPEGWREALEAAGLL
jgi:uncharacterized protein YjbI with pentapeptide repeats